MNRIEKYLNLEKTGFAWEDDLLLFTPNRLTGAVGENEKQEDHIQISSRKGKEISCVFYSSHYRVQCLDQGFVGREGKLPYCIDTTGLNAGDEIRGEFSILSNFGEYRVPYQITVKPVMMTDELGEMRNLFHFANLARVDFAQAVRLFYTEEFQRLFVGHDRQYYNLYRGLSVYPGNAHNVDEFLIGIHKKSAMVYEVAEDNLLFGRNAQGEEQIELHRKGWGYTDITVTAKGKFIRPEKEHLTEEDFEKDICAFSFTILPEYFIEGDNYGSITFTSDSGSVTVHIMIPKQKQQENEKQTADRQRRELLARLMRLYLAYRMQPQNRTDILKEAEKLAEKLNSGYGRSLENRLYQVLILWLQQRENEAKWVLNHVAQSYLRGEIDAVPYTAYLYLRGQICQEEDTAEEAGQELLMLQEERPEAYLPACLYSRIQPDAESRDVFSVLEAHFYRGADSPVLLQTAFSLVEKSPSCLMKLESFEIHILWFAIKYGVYTESLAERTAYLAMRRKEMDRPLYCLLAKSYRLYEREDTLKAMCTLLIRSGKTKGFGKWYACALEKDLRITSLYEYYMMATEPGQLPPKNVLLYFAFQCDLPEERKAALFALILKNQKQLQDLMPHYEPQIESFAWEQLEKGNISEPLATIYRYVFQDPQKLQAAKKALLQVAFTHRISTKAENVCRVIRVQDKLKREEQIPLVKGIAYVSCYTDAYEIFLEDENGNRYQDSSLYEDKKLMNAERIFMRQEAEVSAAPLMLYAESLEAGERHDEKQTVMIYSRLIASDEIEPAYRKQLAEKLMEIYYRQDEQEKLKALLQSCDLTTVSLQQRAQILQYMLYCEMDEQVEKALLTYGFEGVSPKLLAKFITRHLQKDDSYDASWLALALYTFRKGKYTQEMLAYICRYYEGGSRQMQEIMQAALRFDTDVLQLSERILLAAIFTQGIGGGQKEAYAYYVKYRKNSGIAHQYTDYIVYQYFVKQHPAQAEVFTVLEQYLAEEQCSLLSKIAYLQYMAKEETTYTKKQEELIRDLVEQVMERRGYLPFFRSFSGFIPQLHLYANLVCMEYRTEPGTKVSLHYLGDGGGDRYEIKMLSEVCEGYYVKRFVLFFGEKLQYYVTEEKDSTWQLTESGCLENNEAAPETGESRYELLNDLFLSASMGDERTKNDFEREYIRQDLVAGQLFR